MKKRDLPEDRLWTVEETSYFLGVPVATLYYWRCHGGDRTPASLADICGTALTTCVPG